MRRNANVKPSAFSRLLGVIGELLITAGVVILLFILWQVWWTDIVAGREQERLVENFYDKVADSADVIGTEHRDDPPAVDADSIRPTIGTNNIWAILHVPAFGDDYQVGIAEGVDLRTILDQGSLGHYPETQLPGEPGNFALAGHRQTYGAPLRAQPDLETGAPLIVETADNFYVYRVTEHEIVAPSAVEVLAPVPGNPGAAADGHYLTLTTCHPPFVSNQRWITYAELDYWMPRSEGVPKEL